MSERRPKHRISGSGRIIDEGAEEQVPAFVPSAPEANSIPEGLETLATFAGAPADTARREVQDIKATLTVLVDQAEVVITEVCKPLVANRAWIEHVAREMDWGTLNAMVFEQTGRVLPNLHHITTGAEVVYGLAGTFSNQVARLREAVRVLHVTRKAVNPHGFKVHVRTLERQAKALIRDTQGAVDRAWPQLVEHVEKVNTIVAALTGKPAVVVRAKDEVVDTQQKYYDDFNVKR